MSSTITPVATMEALSTFEIASRSSKQGSQGHDINDRSKGSKHKHIKSVSFEDSTSSPRNQSESERITRLVLLVNFSLAVANAFGGYIFGSQAVFADAVHALTDMTADFVALLAVKLSKTPGFEKSEAIGGIAVSGLVVSSGLALAAHASLDLCRHFQLDRVAGCLAYLELIAHEEHHSPEAVSTIQAIGLSLLSILMKEWLYHATIKVARKEKSVMLESHALHQRLDAITAVVALLVNFARHLNPDLMWLDGMGSLVIGVMIIKVGIGNAVAAFGELFEEKAHKRKDEGAH